MSFQSLPERPEGCKTVRAAVLAKRLNVAYQLIEGLAIGGQIQGYRMEGRTGASVLVVPITEVERLERAVGGENR